jgi:hypothetical protein
MSRGLAKTFKTSSPLMFSSRHLKVINNYTSIYTAKRGEVQNLQIIGVHIRRGDYLLPEKIKLGG